MTTRGDVAATISDETGGSRTMPTWKRIWAVVAGLGWAAGLAGVLWWDRTEQAHRGWVLLVIAVSTLTVLTVQMHLHERRLAAYQFGLGGRCPFMEAELAVKRSDGAKR